MVLDFLKKITFFACQYFPSHLKDERKQEPMTLDATRVRMKEEDNILPWVLLFMECELDSRKPSDLGQAQTRRRSGGRLSKKKPGFLAGWGGGGRVA